MAINTSTSPTLATQYQTYYDKKLLKSIKPKLVMDQFGAKVPFPEGKGSKSIRMFRRQSIANPNGPITVGGAVQTLTEGVTSNFLDDVNLTYVETPLAQYGSAVQITDILNKTELFNILKEGIAQMGERAALFCDTIIRNELVRENLSIATQPGAGPVKRYAGGAADFKTMAAATGSTTVDGYNVPNGIFTTADGLDGATQLQYNLAPQRGGAYVAIVPFAVARDLMRDPTWIRTSQYSDKTKIYKGELGEFYGVRYVAHSSPWIENPGNAAGSAANNGGTANVNACEGTYDNSASGTGGAQIFTSIFLGSDAFCCPNMAGMSPFSPSVMVLDKADKSDPYNQRVVATWKAFWAALTSNGNWVVTVRSKSAFNGQFINIDPTTYRGSRVAISSN